MATKRTLAITLVLVTTAGIVTPAFTGGGVVYATDTEPNDDFETAVAISEGTFSGEIVDGESDFFKLNASTTEALSAEVTSADNLDDLTLRIYDADRTQLASDGNAFQGIDATIKLPETGTYYVEVAGQSAGTNSSYTLNIDVVTPAENDQFAPNDDFGSAASIPEGSSEARIVGGESDFYQLEANATDAISVDITSADSLDDLAIRLYDAERSQLAADGNSFQGIDYTIKAPETGTYYIEVLGQSQQTTSNYTLNVDVVTPAENDQFAPNDDFESAASIPEGSSEARIVGGESDFYQLEANVTDAISVDIASADSLDDLAIRLYDAERNQLVADGNSFQGIDYTIKAPETGTYYIEVLGQSQQTTSDYTLNVDVVTPAENDQFAPNDDFESAAPLREEFSDARIVGGELDYYKITLNESESVSAEIRTADSLSDLVIRLYDPGRTQVASDGNDFGGLTISHQATTSGTYYIEIAGQSEQTTSSYELQSNQTFQPDSSNSQVPQNLQRFTGGDDSIGNLDVLNAVNAANSNQNIGGQSVGNLDILRLVNYVNDN
ncbi:PPC domain-containing protein (plasmid) [Haloplanus ruber]|nr:PPC domain-containing protein [Haloplanus ruber]